MDRERAEAHLRLQAETELRRAEPHPAGSARVTRIARALNAVGALEDTAATRIVEDFELALTIRTAGQGDRRHLGRWPPAWLPGNARPPRPNTAPGRVVPLGTVIGVRAGEINGQVSLLSFAQPASRGLLTMIARTCGPDEHGADAVFSFLQFSATDDRGNAYALGLSGSGESGPGEWILTLHPDPPRDLRWLDLVTTPGAPATRVVLACQPPDGPEVTVSATGTDPGEHFLNAIAMRLLAARAAYPQHMPLHVAGLTVGLVVDGLGDIVTALQACRAIPPGSPGPAHLAALCDHLGIRGHGITTAPADSVPEPWRSVLFQSMARRLTRQPARSAPLAAVLPECDGIGLTVLGLHDSGDRSVVFMHGSGMSGGGPHEQDRWPVIWIRDSAGGWHATSANGSADQDREVTMGVLVVPPLSRDTDRIEVVVIGRSAEVRATLPVRWQ